MPDTITPNPPSPFADADPAFRHLIPVITVFGMPEPGALAFTGCDYLAVVPDEPLRDATHVLLPDGLCPTCIDAMNSALRGETPPSDVRPATNCRACGGTTTHDSVCGLCRIEMHRLWAAAGRPDDGTIDKMVEDFRAADALLNAAKASYVAAGAAVASDGQGNPRQGAAPAAEPEPYPCPIVVFCDNICGVEVRHDYVVTDAMNRAERLEVARNHLRTNEGWTCTEAGDFCPACTAKAAQDPKTSQGGER